MQKIKTNKKIIIAVSLIASLFLTLAGCASQRGSVNDPGNNSAGGQGNSAPDSVREIKEGENLTIPISEISETAKFYPIKADGTLMEVIAVKAWDGSIRTAFNTCQVCYDSGRGYYEQTDGKLVCQNCGNQFDMDQVEVESGGCNPWPIFDNNKIVTDDSVTISYDFLKETKQVFANWKTGD